jgi:WD40 repeat protein
MTLKGHIDTLACLEVWKDFLCSGSEDSTIRVWNEGGECVAVLQGHTARVDCLTVWRDCLCSGSWDKTIRVWNTEWNCISVLQGHEYRVTQVSVWNDLLLSCNARCSTVSIRVWNWREKKCIAILKGHTGTVHQTIVWKDTLYSCSSRDKTIRIWNPYSFCQPPSWSIQTHHRFGEEERRRVKTVLMISNSKCHPESPFCCLPKEIVLFILSFAISFTWTSPLQHGKK